MKLEVLVVVSDGGDHWKRRPCVFHKVSIKSSHKILIDLANSMSFATIKLYIFAQFAKNYRDEFSYNYFKKMYFKTRCAHMSQVLN